MANFGGSFTSPYKSPIFIYDIGYSQISRASGTATYSVTVGVHMSSSLSTFGYSLAGTVTIGNVSQRIIFKGNEMWSGKGTHNFTFTLAPTGLSDAGGLVGASFVTDRPGNEGNAGKISLTGYTTNLSVWNTPPSLSGTIRANASQLDMYIPENQTSIAVDWNQAYVVVSDNEGGTMSYILWRELNNSGIWTQLYSGTSRSFNDTIGSGNQGQIVRYRVQVIDSGGLGSGFVYSARITKNIFNKATFLTGSTIGFVPSGKSNKLIAIEGASNTNGNTSFTYTLNSAQVPIYNASGLTTIPTPMWIAIYVDGTLPTTPYIKFSELKTAFAPSYKGVLTMTLTTTNAYGSSGTYINTMKVDITTEPSIFISDPVTSGTYIIGGSQYYIPNRRAININWGPSVDLLTSGGIITYDVQVSYNGGSTYSTLVTGLTALTYTAALPKVSAATSCKFNIIARTAYGTTRSRALFTAITLHYYDPPTIVYDRAQRTGSTATVTGTIYINSSITGLTVNTPLTFTTTGDKVMPATNLTVTNGTNRCYFSTVVSSATVITGLTAGMKFVFVLSTNDKAGVVIGTPATALNLPVKSYLPALDVASSGIGVNALSSYPYALIVGGQTLNNDSSIFGGSMADMSQLVGDYLANGTANKMIWTIGTSWNLWTKQYGLAYEYGTINGVTDHMLTFRGNGVTKVKIGLNTGVGEFSGNIFVDGIAATATAGAANAVVKRDANGYIRSTYFHSSRVDEAMAAASYIYDSGDGFMRKKTLASTRSELSGTPGQIAHFAMSNAPSGWLKANGALISRTAYPVLFSLIGTFYGAGDGSTTFALPDHRGVFIRGWDDARGLDSGRTFGSYQASANLTHTHDFDLNIQHSDGAITSAESLTSGLTQGGRIRYVDVTNPSGGVESRPVNNAQLVCIKY